MEAFQHPSLTVGTSMGRGPSPAIAHLSHPTMTGAAARIEEVHARDQVMPRWNPALTGLVGVPMTTMCVTVWPRPKLQKLSL